MSQETPTVLKFSYIEFLDDLATRGKISAGVVKQVQNLIKDGKIKVSENSGVSLSSVSLFANGSSTIFLPNSYNNNTAATESPRILITVLRMISKISPEKLDELAEGIRNELNL